MRELDLAKGVAEGVAVGRTPGPRLDQVEGVGAVGASGLYCYSLHLQAKLEGAVVTEALHLRLLCLSQSHCSGA